MDTTFRHTQAGGLTLEDHPAPALPHAQAHWLLERKVSMLYAQLPLGLAGTLVAGLWLSARLQGAFPGPRVEAWSGCFLLVAVLRFLDGKAYGRAPGGSERVAMWHRHLLWGAAAQGALWGVAGAFLFPPAPMDQLILVATVVAVTGGGFLSQMPLWPSCLLFLNLAMVPLSLRLLASPEPSHQALGCMGMIYDVLMTIGARRASQWVHRSLRFSLDMEALASELKTANTSLEQYRDHLEALVLARTADLGRAQGAPGAEQSQSRP